jgi:hypothetical protein
MQRRLRSPRFPPRSTRCPQRLPPEAQHLRPDVASAAADCAHTNGRKFEGGKGFQGFDGDRYLRCSVRPPSRSVLSPGCWSVSLFWNPARGVSERSKTWSARQPSKQFPCIAFSAPYPVRMGGLQLLSLTLSPGRRRDTPSCLRCKTCLFEAEAQKLSSELVGSSVPTLSGTNSLPDEKRNR